ncbi:MAG: HAD-IA family hydrolase [Eubacteriales bacterium]|nr:HAD-IA family hydrolase [Eubacteriales bacterium]
MKYKVVVFDLDGTILDTLEDLADSLNYALRIRDFPERTVEETRKFVGNGIRKLIERAVPAGTSPSEIDEVFAVFKEYYKEHCKDKTKPYKGIEELLLHLQDSGCRTAVVSNKADFAVKSLCKSYFPGVIDFAVGEREGIKRKPCPDSLWEVLRVLKVKLDEAIYIGDSEVDIETAVNAGTDCLIVDWGFRKRDFLQEKGAKRIVSSPEEIYGYIRGEQ